MVCPEMLQQSYVIMHTNYLRPSKVLCKPELEIIDFGVDDLVFLNVFQRKGSMHFSTCCKLSLRYIRLFLILERVDEVAYKLVLSSHLAPVHLVFYLSFLKKYIQDWSHIIQYHEIELRPDLCQRELILNSTIHKENLSQNLVK